MSLSSVVKVKWAEHLDSSWVAESLESAVSRDGASELYERLVLMQEIVVTPQEVSACCFTRSTSNDFSSSGASHESSSDARL
jgi:hypothetical protein